MHRSHLCYLACPDCACDLELYEVTHGSMEVVEAGNLRCEQCQQIYPIVSHIPRFVSDSNYANNFGLEWTRHARTQYDSETGVTVSHQRLFEETRWPEDLRDETILEVGSGSVRFSEHLISTGAMVVTTDLSRAVQVNHASNGHKSNVLIVQSDLYRMPFRKEAFDRVLCIGVLQHTPDVEKSFMTLTNYLKPGAQLVIDVYRKFTGIKGLLQQRIYLLRYLLRNVNEERLYAMIERYVNGIWPLARLLHRIPWLGPKLVWFVLQLPYYQQFDLNDAALRDWARLDLYDMLSPKYDQPQTLESVTGWFECAGLVEIEVHYGHNGIEGRALRVD